MTDQLKMTVHWKTTLKLDSVENCLKRVTANGAAYSDERFTALILEDAKNIMEQELKLQLQTKMLEKGVKDYSFVAAQSTASLVWMPKPDTGAGFHIKNFLVTWSGAGLFKPDWLQAGWTGDPVVEGTTVITFNDILPAFLVPIGVAIGGALAAHTLMAAIIALVIVAVIAIVVGSIAFLIVAAGATVLAGAAGDFVTKAGSGLGSFLISALLIIGGIIVAILISITVFPGLKDKIMGTLRRNKK
jgi:hypothetical protein